MRVLLYVGYQAVEFDGRTNTGIAGTELAVINIAKELVKFGYKVVVSGEVKNSGLIDGVEWIHTDELHFKYYNQFDVIISASYIHFVLEFENYNAKKVFWAHNTHHYPWWKGKIIETADELLHQVDRTVCLTEWHKHQWSNTYGIDLNKIEVLGNGLDTSTFVGTPQKIKGKFIWTSAVDRGLSELLYHWPKIKSAIPHASLDIYAPSYSPALVENYNTNNLIDVNFIGDVDQITLHDAMLRAEYWCYITDYEETYCMTALEMQYAKVLPIVTRVAALSETVNSGIILERNETNWDQVVKILDTLGSELKNKSTESAFQWAKQQTWNARSYDWKNLLESL